MLGVYFVRPSERIYLSYSINSLSLFMLKVSHPKVSHLYYSNKDAK